MVRSILISVLCLFTAPCFAAQTYQELANEYATAYLQEDIETIFSLYYDAWDQCDRPEFNERIQALMKSKTFEFKKNYSGYTLEIETADPSGRSDFLDLGQIEYYPVEPTHSLRFKVDSGLSSMAILNIENQWFLAHQCDGKDVENILEYLETGELGALKRKQGHARFEWALTEVYLSNDETDTFSDNIVVEKGSTGSIYYQDFIPSSNDLSSKFILKLFFSGPKNKSISEVISFNVVDGEFYDDLQEKEFSDFNFDEHGLAYKYFPVVNHGCRNLNLEVRHEAFLGKDSPIYTKRKIDAKCLHEAVTE